MLISRGVKVNNLSILSGIGGILIGCFLGFIFDRHIIKYQEYKTLARDVRFIFVEIRKIILDNKNNFDFSTSDHISKQLYEIDLAINKLLSSCNLFKKVRINKKYNQFLYPYNRYINKGIKKYSLNIYDFIENEFVEHFPNTKVKNGKELAIKNLDGLIRIIR